MTENAGQQTESLRETGNESVNQAEGKQEDAKEPEGRIGRMASQTKDAVDFVGKEMAHELKKPTTGAAVAGAVVVGAAVTLGAVETGLGAATAYVTYRILKRLRAKEPNENKGS